MNQNIGYDEYIIPYLFSMVLEHAKKKNPKNLKTFTQTNFLSLNWNSLQSPTKIIFPLSQLVFLLFFLCKPLT